MEKIKNYFINLKNNLQKLNPNNKYNIKILIEKNMCYVTMETILHDTNLYIISAYKCNIDYFDIKYIGYQSDHNINNIFPFNGFSKEYVQTILEKVSSNGCELNSLEI